MSGFDQNFSVLALFILFRETIEASIICSVLLQFISRSKPALTRIGMHGDGLNPARCAAATAAHASLV
jgi:hypothetical protein